MNWATIGDVEQSLPLIVVEVAGQFDVAINMIDPPPRGFTLRAVFGMNARVPQRHSDPLERPALTVGVHPHRHGGTRPERGQQQIVGCWSRIVANRPWLVGDELVLPYGGLLRITPWTRPFNGHQALG